MNPDPECNCCAPSSGDASGLPQCSSAPYMRYVFPAVLAKFASFSPVLNIFTYFLIVLIISNYFCAKRAKLIRNGSELLHNVILCCFNNLWIFFLKN